MAKKLGTPNYFDYYAYGKGSGVTPDLFKQYSGGEVGKLLTSPIIGDEEDDDEAKKRLEKEISNLEKRAAAAGVAVNKDKRNGLEKFLNMGQDQGLIGDTFELLMRPTNAVSNVQNENAKRVKPLKEKLKRGEITEKQYYEAINKMDKDNFKKMPGEFMDGLTGKKKVTSEDTLETVGMEKGWGRTLTGLGLDIAQDPLNLAGAAIGKGVVAGGKGVIKGADKLLDVVDKNKVFKEGVADVTDTLKQVFNNTAPDSVKNFKSNLEARKNMLQEKSLLILNHLIKNPATKEQGEAAARLMEANLSQAPDVTDFAQKLVDGAKDDSMRLRGTEKIGVVKNADGTRSLEDVNVLNNDIERLVQDMNQQINNSPRFQKDLGTKQVRQQNHTEKVTNMATKYKGLDNLDKLVDDAHVLLQNELPKIELRLKSSGMHDDDVADILEELTGKLDLYNILDSSVKPAMVAAKIGAANRKVKKLVGIDVIKNIGLTSDGLKETVVDAWVKNKSLDMAKKFKNDQIEMLNPIQINKLDGGEAGTGFQITKKSSVHVASGLKDKEKLIEKFGKDTVTIPRIQRELSKSPEAQNVSTALTNMQNEIVSWGAKLGIDIPQMEGYMRHAITEEYKNLNLKGNATGMGKQYGGNAKVINPRDLYGSAEDVNEMMGKEVFETNAYKAMVQAHTKVTNYVATEAFVRNVIEDPNLATKVTKGLDISKYLHPKTGKLKREYTELKLSDFKFYKTLDEDARSILAVRPGEKWIVDKGTVNLMKNYDDLVANDSVLQKLLSYTLDPATRLWKGVTLMSTGYHVRNVMGNAINRHLAGMTADAQVKFDGKATQLIYQYQKKVIPLVAQGKPVTGKLANIQKTVEDFYASGLRDTAKVRDEMGQFDKRYEKLQKKLTGKGKPTTAPTMALNAITAGPKALIGANYKGANALDDIQRMGMYMWAKENSIANPVMKVKEAMFDYSDLTQTEKTFMKRVMPFYTFARNNLPYQVKNLITQPHKINNINKTVESSYSGADIDEENMPEYLRKAMAIGTPFGENQVVKAYLPQSDLKNFLDTPSSAFKQGVSMTAPAIKLPFELFSSEQGRDFFRDQEIRKFEGEKSESYGGIDPKWAYTLDQMGGKNIDRAVRALANLGQPKEGNWATNTIPSLFSTFDPKKVEESKLYDRRKELQDIQKVYEQETGKEFQKVSEIDKGTSSGGYFGF